MSDEYRITALIGSTQEQSTSKSMVNYLQKQFSSHGIKTDIFQANEVYQAEDKLNNLLTSLSESELFLLCTPIYIDGLPYPLMSTFEQIHSCKDNNFFQEKKLITIIHSGFPGKVHRETAINICHNFARSMGFDWEGAVDFGMSVIIEGNPLNQLGFATKWIRKSLAEVVEELVKEERSSSSVIRNSLDLPIPIPIPIKFFPSILNFVTSRKIKDEGVKDVLACPYSQE